MAKTISEALVQTRFRNTHHKALLALLYAGNQINGMHQEFFKRFGISGQQFNALRILRGQYPKPSTINLIRERMLDKMSDVSRLVERLRKADLVERYLNENDRRSVDVVISSKGLALLEQIDAEIDQVDYPMTLLTETEAATLLGLLEKIIL